MGFDYEDAINRVIGMQTFRNADGTAKTVSLLNGLRYCPFIGVVAEIHQITTHHLYRLLRYYLGEDTLNAILRDVGERKSVKYSELFEQEKRDLKTLLKL